MASFASIVPALIVIQQQGQLPPVGTLKAPPPRVQDSSVPPVLTLPMFPNTEVPNEPLTADEAARIALKLQPSISNAQGAVKQARGEEVQVAAQLYPQVNLGAGYDYIRSLSGPMTVVQGPYLLPLAGVSETNAYNGAAQIKQLIFDFNHTRELVSQDRDLVRVAEANLSAQQLTVVFNVKQAFYAYANAERLVAVNEANVVNRQRQLDLANARFNHGIGEPSDVVNAETSKSQGISALSQAREAAGQAAVTLLNLIGVDPLTPINVPVDAGEKEVVANDPKALIDTALKARPEVRSARFQVSASGHGLSAARTLNMPSIYASAAGGMAGQKFPLTDNVVAVSVGVSFPIIDGGTRNGAIEQAEGQLQSSQAGLSTAQLSVENDVANAFIALKNTEQTLVTANQEVANAAEGVRIAEGRYAANFGQFQDILTAQGLLVGAQTDQAQARNAVDQARTQLRHAIGLMFSDQPMP
jgi:outer membrane protein TolC